MWATDTLFLNDLKKIFRFVVAIFCESRDNKPELVSGWDFFGIPNPGDRDLDLKIPKIPKFSVFAVFWPTRFFRDFLKIPGIFGKSQGFGIFFLSLVTLIPGILVPGNRDFSLFRDFNPRDRDFFVGWDIPTKSQLW